MPSTACARSAQATSRPAYSPPRSELGYFNVAGLGQHFTLHVPRFGTVQGPERVRSVPRAANRLAGQDLLLRRGRGLLRAIAPLALMALRPAAQLLARRLDNDRRIVVLMVGADFPDDAVDGHCAAHRHRRLRRRVRRRAAIGLALSIPEVRDIADARLARLRTTTRRDRALRQSGALDADVARTAVGFGPLQFALFPGRPARDVPQRLRLLRLARRPILHRLHGDHAVRRLAARLRRSPYQSARHRDLVCLFVQMIQGFRSTPTIGATCSCCSVHLGPRGGGATLSRVGRAASAPGDRIGVARQQAPVTLSARSLTPSRIRADPECAGSSGAPKTAPPAPTRTAAPQDRLDPLRIAEAHFVAGGNFG